MQRRRKESSADGLEEFNANKMNISSFLLPFYPGLDGGHTCWYKTGRGDGGGGNRQGDDIVDRQGARTGEKRSQSTDIQGFGQIEKLFPVGVSATDEERDLEMEPL